MRLYNSFLHAACIQMLHAWNLLRSFSCFLSSSQNWSKIPWVQMLVRTRKHQIRMLPCDCGTVKTWLVRLRVQRSRIGRFTVTNVQSPWWVSLMSELFLAPCAFSALWWMLSNVQSLKQLYTCICKGLHLWFSLAHQNACLHLFTWCTVCSLFRLVSPQFLQNHNSENDHSHIHKNN